MDKAPAYGAGDSGFESRYGLIFTSDIVSVGQSKKDTGALKLDNRERITEKTNCASDPVSLVPL